MNDPSQSPAGAVIDYRGVSPAKQQATWAAHPLDDAFWQRASVPATQINIPTLMIGGWEDYMVVGDIANFHDLHGPNAWLVMGPWEHNGQPPALRDSMLLAWFDHWLMQRSSAPLPSGRVTSFELTPSGTGSWTEMPSYPPPGTVSSSFTLNTDRTLGSTAGPSGSHSYRVNPKDGPPAICFSSATGSSGRASAIRART
jgi:predicted acyl esterase